MARLAGVDLPREKRMEIALTYIYGIGKAHAKETLAATGVSPRAIPAAPMASEQATTCAAPSPKTSRRRTLRRSQDSSMPIVNRRKTTPNSAR